MWNKLFHRKDTQFQALATFGKLPQTHATIYGEDLPPLLQKVERSFFQATADLSQQYDTAWQKVLAASAPWRWIIGLPGAMVTGIIFPSCTPSGQVFPFVMSAMGGDALIDHKPWLSPAVLHPFFSQCGEGWVERAMRAWHDHTGPWLLSEKGATHLCSTAMEKVDCLTLNQQLGYDFPGMLCHRESVYQRLHDYPQMFPGVVFHLTSDKEHLLGSVLFFLELLHRANPAFKENYALFWRNATTKQGAALVVLIGSDFYHYFCQLLSYPLAKNSLYEPKFNFPLFSYSPDDFIEPKTLQEVLQRMDDGNDATRKHVA